MPDEEPPDFTRLLEGARDGSAEAWKVIMDTSWLFLLQVADKDMPRCLCGQVSPRDLAQVSLQRAYERLHQFEGDTWEMLLGWLRTILINYREDLRRQTEGSAANPRPQSVGQDVENGVTQQLIAPGPSPEEVASEQEEAERVHRTLRQLPRRHQQVIRLRVWDGLSFEEVGRRLGRSADAARMLWSRALENFARILGVPDEP